MFNFSSIGKLIMNLFATPPAGAESRQIDNIHTVQGGGFNLGNAGGWSNSYGEFLTQNYNRRGITQTRSGVQNKHAVGDAAGIYTYVRSDGGIAAASDEGETAITGQVLEPPTWFHGTVTSTTGTGDTAPVLAFTSGSNWTTDGGYLLNITKGTLHGTLTGSSASLSLTVNSGVAATFLNYLTVAGATLPLSTAIGIATGAIAPAATTRDVPVAVSITVNLAQIGGIYKLFTNGSVVTVAGNEYPEQSIVSGASGLLAGNQQTFTLHLCNPNLQAVIFQGGIQGQYISADANTMRSAYFAFGSLFGNDLIYGNQVAGGLTGNTLPNAGCEAWQATGANSAWHLYPGAEVVANTDSGFACKLEQNGVVWAATDVVECARFPTSGGFTAFFNRVQYIPTNAGFGGACIYALMSGPGTAGIYGARIENGQPASSYIGDGGPLKAPIGIGLLGTYDSLIVAQKAPDTGSLILVSQNNAAGSDVIEVINLDYATGGNFTFRASTSRWAVDGAFDAQNGFYSNHIAGISGTITTAKLTTGGTNGSMTFNGGILVGQVQAT
jgi:hypothetical protein